MNKQTPVMQAMTLDCERAVDRIVAFLRHKMTAGGKTGICLGISGGIDSAVTAKLAVIAANDPSNVYGLYLPDRDSDDKYRHRAMRLADELNIHLQTIDIGNRAKAEGVYDAPVIRFLRISPTVNRLSFRLYKRALNLLPSPGQSKPDNPPGRKHRHQIKRNSLFNLKKFLSISDIFSGFESRHILRRQILEKYADEKNLLLIGAANKSEVFMGWFVKDGVDDLPVAPIMGLYKNQVIQLAKYLNIPDDIIHATPSPDMLKGLHDEEIMGFTYDQIDTVAYLDEHRLPQQHAGTSGISPDAYEKMLLIHQYTAEKRTNQHEFPAVE